MQVLVLSEVNKSSEQCVIQAKLQLVEAERQKAEAEQRDARIAQELEARKRDEAERDANMAEIWYSNGYNSSSITARDTMLLSTLWFSR